MSRICFGCNKIVDLEQEYIYLISGNYFYCSECVASKKYTCEDKHDKINHPSYYKGRNGIEAIEVVEGFELGFHTASAVDYILRAGKKDPNTEIDDYKKAIWFLERKIKIMGENK